ncbi:MAG: hypothetical protein ACHQ7N_13920 [Candidatus Methylomirabilales bacterium]
MCPPRGTLGLATHAPAVGAREDRPDITATGIADFTYCAHGWWLKRVGGQKPQGTQLRQGTISHGNAGAMIATMVSIERVVKILAVGVGCIAVAVIVMLLRAYGM